MKNLQDDPKKLATLDDVIELLNMALNTFEDDLPNSGFQEGYEHALSELRYRLLGISPPDRLHTTSNTSADEPDDSDFWEGYDLAVSDIQRCFLGNRLQ